MAKIFASVFRILDQIVFDLRIAALNHYLIGIAAICIELAGNSQKWAESAR
ncbi:hypothetical protein ACNO8X_23230 [Mycobacterium sp. PDNC021]|uniref:hypothetical protein n=1 Tax=Mycobacterium sp. PDNC021 TaxID=3391399 RepID=UPI003AB03EE2